MRVKAGGGSRRIGGGRRGSGQDFFIFNLIGRPRLNKGVEITSCPGLGQPAPPSSDAGDDHGGEGGAPWPPTELGLE